MSQQLSYTFTNELEELSVSSLGAAVKVEPCDGDSVTVEYLNPDSKPEMCVVICGRKLMIKETVTFGVFSRKSAEGYSITLKVPSKQWKSLAVNTGAGAAEIAEGVTAERLTVNSGSGNVTVGSYFEDVNIRSASGQVTLSCSEGKTAKSLRVSSASGTVEIEDYKAERFSLTLASGKANYTGAVGEGAVKVTSGTVEVVYSKWESDLKISAISGKATVRLPEGSGANIRFDGVSGAVRTNLGNPEHFLLLGKGTNGEFGGEPKHNITVNLVSGEAVITDGAAQ